MDERSSRIFVGLCLLVLLWIGTYWLYEPGRPASGAEVSFDPIEVSRFQMPGNTVGVPDPELDSVSDPVPEPGIEDPEPSSEPAEINPSTGVVVVPPRFRDYVIQPDDTFKSIARDELGNVGLWQIIAGANPLRDPRRIKAGDVIRLPLDPSNIQGMLVSEADGEPINPVSIDVVADPWVEYTVQSGDSLSRIAKSYYGSSRHADAIFDANRDQLRSPDALKIGQVLLLPPISTDD